MWYNYNKLLSYDCLFNFIIGERGVGKTYNILKYCINRYIKYKEEFVYLRRYKTELKKFDTITQPLVLNNEFNGYKIESKNKKILVNGEVAGYGIPLSTAITMKSSSFPKVKYIVFDEFIIDKGSYRYLPNEVESFLEMYETISRLNDVKVFFLGNAITEFNPYFSYFDLTLPYGSDFKRFKNDIVINYIRNEEYRKVKKESRFGRLIEGTSYSKYAIDNEFLRDNKNMIMKRPYDSKLIFNFYLNNELYGLWLDDDNNGFISYDHNDNSLKYYILISDTKPNTLMIKKTDGYGKIIGFMIRKGMMFYESNKIKNNCEKVLNNFI